MNMITARPTALVNTCYLPRTRSVVLVDVKGALHRVVHEANNRTQKYEAAVINYGGDALDDEVRLRTSVRGAVRIFFTRLVELCTRIPIIGDDNKRHNFDAHKPILCFDQHGGQRRPLIESYKEGRKEPAAVTRSLEIIRTVAEDAGLLVFPTCRDLVVEADDLIDTAVRVLHEQDPEGYRIVDSVDKDLLACLRHGDGYNTCVYRCHKNVWVHKSNVMEVFDVPADRISEFLAINGDTSDGVPPLRSLSGEKRAPAVLRCFSDLFTLAKDLHLSQDALRTLIMNYSLTVPHNVPDVVARLDSSPNVYDSINFLRSRKLSSAMNKGLGCKECRMSGRDRFLRHKLEVRVARAEDREAPKRRFGKSVLMDSEKEDTSLLEHTSSDDGPLHLDEDL
eukprot:PhM_4_TR5192/c1_g1_i2/m.46764